MCTCIYVPHTWHDARRRHATPKPRSISPWSRQRSLQTRLLRRFKSSVACIRGLLVSSCDHAAESIQLHTSGIPLASDMQPRSHPSPPRITRCLFVRCWSYRHTAPHSTVKARPARMQRIEITKEAHPPTGVSAPKHNSTIGPDLPFHLSLHALVPWPGRPQTQ